MPHEKNFLEYGMVFIVKTAKIDSRLVYHLKLLHLFIDGKTVVFFTA